MCLPAAAILTAVSTGVGLIAQNQQTKAQAAMYNAQAQAAEANSEYLIGSKNKLQCNSCKNGTRWIIVCAL